MYSYTVLDWVWTGCTVLYCCKCSFSFLNLSWVVLYVCGLFRLPYFMFFYEPVAQSLFNPLYTGRLFHCYMLDTSSCHCRGVRSILSLLFYFLWNILLANNVDPDQTPHDVASDQGLHCLPMTLYGFLGKNGLSPIEVTVGSGFLNFTLFWWL